jgi:pimeloyl-ACP methyl ester carboxylesterase
MNGLESFLLRDRLAKAGFAPSVFRYPSMNSTLTDVTAALAARLRSFEGTVHLVGHSLGGVVVLETLERELDLPPGRIVLLGSPVRGSRAARSISAWSVGPLLLGALAVAELARERDRNWSLPREIGLIAGCRSAGLGRVFADLPQPNDGTICVDETKLPGATAQIVLDVSHTGMLVSSAVAGAVGRFLIGGTFGPLTQYGLSSNRAAR